MMIPHQRKYLSLVILSLHIIAGTAFAQTSSEPEAGELREYRERYGHAEMNISCETQAHIPFEKGLLQLHSFAWETARQSFQEASRLDPECAMAYWGEAMTYYDGLHEHPSASEVESARQALSKARRATTSTSRETAYIAAAEELFRDYPDTDRIVRETNYSKAMGRVSRAYPQDEEAAIFHALSLLMLGRRGLDDDSFQSRATEILEPLFDQLPNHPGVAHYLIHAYDDIARPELGLAAARRYASIAPVLTHPQHMPAHIFAGLGMWKENNISNQTALDANPAYYHALMYLVYGHLQIGQQEKAKELTDQLRNLALSTEGGRAERRGLHSINTWLLLETRDWQAAADVPIYSDAALDVAEALYLRGLGSAYTDNLDKARDVLNSLNKLISELSKSNDPDLDVRIQLMRIQTKQVEALIRTMEGRGDEAILLMREAVDIADSPGVTRLAPDSGTGLPAHELFGEILMTLEQYPQAVEEFKTSLERTPNRLHSIIGLARSAAATGNHSLAQEQYQLLLKQLEESDPGLAEVNEARNYLSKTTKPH